MTRLHPLLYDDEDKFNNFSESRARFLRSFYSSSKMIIFDEQTPIALDARRKEKERGAENIEKNS